MQAIYGAIEAADTFIFVLTPDSVASVPCSHEIAHAAAHNKRMVPIVARDVRADTVPEPLAKLNWIFFRDSDDFEKATDTLISALDTDLKWVHAHTRLLTRAIEWNANGKNNSFVLRGDDLRSAERWLADASLQKERQPTALQTEYIIASRKAAARRQRITLGAVTFGLLLACSLTSRALGSGDNPGILCRIQQDGGDHSDIITGRFGGAYQWKFYNDGKKGYECAGRLPSALLKSLSAISPTEVTYFDLAGVPVYWVGYSSTFTVPHPAAVDS